MSNVANDTTNSNTTSDSQVEDTSTDVSNNALSEVLEATAEETKKIADYRAAEARLVDLAVSTLDPKDMLKKYARMGKEALLLAHMRRNSLAAGGWNGKDDLKKVCSDSEDLIRMRVPIKQIDMSLYIRIHVWVEAAKALVPNVEKLSYFQVANKFVPTLKFDPSDLSGEIKKDWMAWVHTTVERQLSDNPMSMKDLDASIKERTEEIKREQTAKSKRTPEQVLEAELKAANRKKIADRQAAQSKVSNAVADALLEGNADVNDIVAVVRQVVEQADGLTMPERLVGFDPINCTVEDCKVLARAMNAAGKLAEMIALRDTLDLIVKKAQNAMITSKSA